METPLLLLIKAQSIIQREAILSELAESHIPAVTSPRDMSRKMADDTVDLALEGYSVFFDGFPIYVAPADLERAQAVVNDVLKQAQAAGRQQLSTEESPHFQRFFFCSLFSFIIPVLLHLVGAYQFYLGWKAREKIRPFKLAVSLILYFSAPVFFVFTQL